MIYDNIIDKNNKITNDFKQIAKECFYEIFQTLGKNNFIRWVHTRELSEDVKNLIFDWMTEQEKNDFPNFVGISYFNRAEIKIRHPNNVKDTSIHETYHLLTRHSNSFVWYIDEGMTEYLKGMTSKNGPTAYRENVRMVNFLHKMLGDSIVKAYLLGKDQKFDNMFEQLLAEDSTDLSQTKKDIQNFYSILDKRHSILHPIKDSTFDKKELDQTTIQVKDMIRKIILGKTRQLAKNLEFYQDGKLSNLNLPNTWIKMIPPDFNFSFEELYNLEHDALGVIFDNSHLLVGLSENEKHAKKEDLINSIISPGRNAKGDITQITYNYNSKTINNEDPEITSKIFEKSFKNKNISILDFTDKILNIATHIPISDRQLQSLISQYIISLFGDKVDIPLIDSLVKQNLHRYKSLFEVENQRNRETIESLYRKIDDNSYIEKRDNQYFYIKIDDKGNLQETELNYSNSTTHPDKTTTTVEELPPNDLRVIKANENEKDNLKRKVYLIRDNNSTIVISIKNDLNSIQVHNKEDKFKDFGIMDIKEFRELELLSPIMNQLKLNIQKRKYETILNDNTDPYKIKGVSYTADIDERSRQVDYNLLSKDLRCIDQLLENKKSKILQKHIISSVLDKTFGTVPKKDNGKLSRSPEAQKAYDSIIEMVISNKIDDTKIMDATKTLNNLRRNRIKENKKIAMVNFSTPEAKQQYEKQQKFNNFIDQNNLKFKLQHDLHTPGAIPIGIYYISEGKISEELQDKLNHGTYGLNGAYFLGPNIDDRNRTLLTDKLCKDLDNKTAKLTDTKTRKEIIGNYLEFVLDHIYEISKNERNKNPELQTSYDNISHSIIDNIINGTEINQSLIDSNMSVLNENRRSKILESNKKSGHLIGFRDKTSQVIYRQLCSLSRKLPKSQLDIVAEGLVNATNEELISKGEKNEEIK